MTRIALALVLAILTAGAAAAERPTVVTTMTVIADMGRNVAGEAADVVSLIPAGAEVHDYQPTPGDIRRAQGADLILWNGLGLENWFERFFQHLSGVPSVVVSDGVEPVAIAEGPYAGAPDPHAWMSPDNALVYVENIRAALAEADPANAEVYAANAAAYAEEIAAMAEPIRAMLAEIPPERRWFASSEGAFNYLARDFGLNTVYIWPINEEGQGTPQQVRRAIDAIRANEVPVIFSESTIASGPAEQVARETGIRYGGELYVDSLSGPGGPVPTYLDLLRVTSERIAEALTQ